MGRTRRRRETVERRRLTGRRRERDLRRMINLLSSSSFDEDDCTSVRCSGRVDTRLSTECICSDDQAEAEGSL